MARVRRSIKETLIARALLLAGLSSIILVILIFGFVLKEGAPLFSSASAASFFGGKEWQPTLPPPAGPNFGLLPNLWGTILVTIGAALIAIPLALAGAIFVSEVAPARLKAVLKGTVELLSLVPSVALGFVGVVAVSPLIKNWLDLDTGKSAIVGSVMLAFLALPTILTVSEDAISAVPRSFRDASLALGSTHLQSVFRVVVPAAAPGIFAGVALGVGRAVGETMVVIMVTGNAGLLPDHGIWYAFTHSVRTITGTIGAEALEVANGEPHYHALFLLGSVLFAMTFVLNYLGDYAMRKQTKGYRR